MELNPEEKRALLNSDEEWRLERCPRHEATPSPETVQICQLCAAFLFLCPLHDELPSAETKERCEECKKKFWTPDLCPRHSRKPSKETRKECVLCEKYLCKGCHAAPRRYLETRTQCDSCASRYQERGQRKEETTSPSQQPGMQYCKTGQHCQSISHFTDEGDQDSGQGKKRKLEYTNCLGRRTKSKNRRKARREPALQDLEHQSIETSEPEHSEAHTPNSSSQQLPTSAIPLREPVLDVSQDGPHEYLYYGNRLLVEVVASIIEFRATPAAEKVSSWATGIDSLFDTLPQLKSECAMDETPQTLPLNEQGVRPGHTAWLSATCKAFENFIKSGGKLPDCVSTLRITNSFNDIDIAPGRFLEYFTMGANPEIQYQNWNRTRTGKSSSPTQPMSGSEFLERFKQRQEAKVREDCSDFRNFLSISGAALDAEVPEPHFVRSLNYTLLVSLRRHLHAKTQTVRGNRTALGKEVKKARLRDIDMESCFRFVLYGERYSYSGWHLDVLNGTWVTMATGMRAWFIYTGPWTEKEKAEFARDGPSWSPPSDTVQVILLRPGDTLIMRPGYPVIHAVLTLDDSLAAGGMLWAGDSVHRIMANMRYIVENTQATNEDIPRQLPEYLDALQQRIQKYKTPKPRYKKGKAQNAQLAQFLHDVMRLPSFSDHDQQSLSDLVAFLKGRDLLSCKCLGACVTGVEKRTVREIIGSRLNDDKRDPHTLQLGLLEYGVSWKGRDKSDPWQPYHSLRASKKAIQNFHNKYPDKLGPHETFHDYDDNGNKANKDTSESNDEGDPEKYLCPCWRGSAVHVRGCTTWCHHEEFYANPPACAE